MIATGQPFGTGSSCLEQFDNLSGDMSPDLKSDIALVCHLRSINYHARFPISQLTLVGVLTPPPERCQHDDFPDSS